MVPECAGSSSRASTFVAVGLAVYLGTAGCTAVREQGRLGPAEQQQLNSSLNVASASADAGQFEAAERLYTELSRHFPDAPEPRIGLGYLALRAGDFTRASRLFAEGEVRAKTAVAKAEALLGAGRASLSNGDVAGAKAHFVAASAHAKSTAAEAWVANGLGVVATLEGEHGRARQHFDEAFKLSEAHPMITANLVRALAQSGEREEARKLYAKYSATHWLDSDAADLSRLLQEGKQPGTAATASIRTPTASSIASTQASQGSKMDSGAQVQLYAARTEAGAMAAWRRLSSAEKDLLGSLTPRVMKTGVTRRGVFHRLRAGPLTDKAAARRLCRLLKKRGRDCFVPAAKWTRSGPTGTGDAAHAAATRPEKSRGAAPAARDRPVVPAPERKGARPVVLVQLHAARSQAEALTAWRRLSGAEEELLGAMTPRVVKVEIAGKGVFYRLFVGPVPDMSAARRLCRLLKERGRGCLVRQ